MSTPRRVCSESLKNPNIHMVPFGYAGWKSVVAPVIVPAEKPFERKK